MNKEIQRFCWFDTIGKKESNRGTIWKYKRAIEGHKLLLAEWKLMTHTVANDHNRFFQIYDGHTYSHWGSFRNIFDQSTLDAFSSSRYTGASASGNLHNWECKELTMSARSEDPDYVTQFVLIVYFYEVPMTKAERFEYAVKQPRYKYRHGFATTLDRFEG
ncbi:hypothetical protein ES703_89487 [subsurface metagenome]